MARINQEAFDYEIKRWMRPDWRRYFKPGQENDSLYRLYERIERKYRPDQPRVPAGSPEGGQWTASAPADRSTSNTRIAARISPTRAEECELMHRQDLFICRATQSPVCYEQAYLRYSNCLAGRPIPPLNF